MPDPTVGELRYDKVIIRKQGGNAELQILNSTRDVAGFLYNLGDGLTEFREADGMGGDDQVFIDPYF
ncbi:MAG TPA: hypothetical protein VK618_11685 [Flavitalea sp.]|nr:hypothetical protein [Flavitalea sp.]